MMSRCRSCQAPIRWARTLGGKKMPLDPVPSPNGNVQLATVGGQEIALVLGAADVAAAQIERVPLYLTHFASCPNVEQHRKPKAAA